MLNTDQERAVNCTADHILCLAGAGTGKTYSLIERVNKLVDDGVAPSSILVLTFTNAAALEMNTRYAAKRPKEGAHPNFRTFHSFCYSLIASDLAVRSELGYQSLPDIATDAETKEITKLAAEQSGIKLSTKGTPTEFIRETLHKATKRLMIARNLITFDIMCYDVCKLFVNDTLCIKKYKDRYTHIFVDEFQDTDPKQWEFVQSFSHSKVFIVGDAIQAIYAFRGADSSIIKNIADDSDWTKVRLTYNYRSTSQICDFANKHSDHGEDSYRVKIHSVKQGDAVTEVFYEPSDDLRSIVLECNRRHVSNGGSCAILCRTNAEVQAVASMCHNLHIPVVTKDAETDVILGLLRSVNDDTYAITWLASKLKSVVYNRYLRQSFISSMTLDQFAEMFLQDPDLDYLRDKVDTIKRWRADLSNIQSLYDMNQFIHEVGPRSLKDVSNIHKKSDLINALIELYNTPDDSTLSDMYVGTIHSAKGLEYDSVMLLSVGGKSFRLTNEENLNLYYVGITRARDHLYIWKGDMPSKYESFEDID